MPKAETPAGTLAAYDRDGSERQQVRAQITTFKGRKYFSLRAWYWSEDDQDYKPSKNGINLPIDEYEEFSELLVALNDKIGKDHDDA